MANVIKAPTRKITDELETPLGSADRPRQISFWDYHSEGDPKPLAGFDRSY